MKDNKLSITCPNCGKLNVIGSPRCSNSGHPLPNSNQWGLPQHQRIPKRLVGITLTVAAVLAMILLWTIIQHNQALSYATFLNSAPQKVILYNARHRPVKTVYLIGDQRKKTTTGIQGTLVVANKVRPDSDYRNLRPVRYTDSRSAGMVVIETKPTMRFYYPERTGKLTYNGRCTVAGHPDVRYFSWQNISGGVTK